MNNEGLDAVLRNLCAMRDQLESAIEVLEREQMVILPTTPPPPPLDVRGITKHGGFRWW
jgi:hypothetical protein